jgi:hypothetical protein
LGCQQGRQDGYPVYALIAANQEFVAIVIADPAFDSLDSALRELEKMLGLPPVSAESQTGRLLRASDTPPKQAK